MRGPPIRFQVLCHVLASLLQLILVQDHVEHLGRALGELLGGHHLHVEVSDLRLAPRLDQPLEHFGRGDLQVDDRRRQTGLGQLRRVIDRVAVQHYQLDYYFKSLIIFFFSGRERERDRRGWKKGTWRVLASSKILSISAWTSAKQLLLLVDRSMMARFVGLLSNDLFANEMSAITLVIIILKMRRNVKNDFAFRVERCIRTCLGTYASSSRTTPSASCPWPGNPSTMDRPTRQASWMVRRRKVWSFPEIVTGEWAQTDQEEVLHARISPKIVSHLRRTSWARNATLKTLKTVNGHVDTRHTTYPPARPKTFPLLSVSIIIIIIVIMSYRHPKALWPSSAFDKLPIIPKLSTISYVLK